ncbi:sugar nucleotide-binding protein [Oceanobacter sp. 3_MG-2023]|uniref:sugar nucleotide-binding protein n=1 Tax=Oceanobacter sp. 3_MG-2023 TaxID=3062622 RepID=UPI002733B237|nr:sugar nucleotide-binding protein [Oceanobacter sp. 3_MG-2023]MDP2505754.1 sugar nucleotide-binding protein [Oceanobacter sp. 3_MG-2023]
MSVNPFYSYVIGADRSIGQCLTRVLAAENYVYKGLAIERQERLSVQSTGQPFFVLVPSLYHPGDLSEVLAWVDLADKHDAPVVLVSSLALFAADDSHRFSESDEQYSSSELGMLLQEVEQRIRQCRRHLILRVGQTFSVQAGDFAHALLTRIRDSGQIEVDDQRTFSPTPDDDIASVLLAMLKQADCSDELWGTYHFCGVEPVTSYAFAEALLAEAGQFEDLSCARLIEHSDGISPAIWTPNGDVARLFHTFGIKRKPWRTGLGRLVRRYYRAA